MVATEDDREKVRRAIEGWKEAVERASNEYIAAERHHLAEKTVQAERAAQEAHTEFLNILAGGPVLPEGWRTV